MNLEAEILKEHSKHNTLRIAAWVGNDRRRFTKLMTLFLRGEYRVTQRSAWIINTCAGHYPELPRPHLRSMIRKAREPGVHDAVKRNVVSILQFIEIPSYLLGEVAALCFDFLASSREPVAVKCFAMTVLARIALRKPGIRRELLLHIEQQLPWASPGFSARARAVKKTLSAKDLTS